MCGIAGYLDPEREADPERLERMSARLTHRGPDGAGTWTEGGLGLCHRRLAILDPSDAGHQPMVSDDGDRVLVYNGEVYNYVELRQQLEARGHRFQSGTDTEVVLEAYAAWGPECARRFNGMWALALWDRKQQRLWLSRDRFGVKPLFYAARPDGTFVFASEAKAILAGWPELARPDLETLRVFLEVGGVDWDNRTFFDGIRSLPPAHNGFVGRGGRLATERYWQFDPDAARAGLDDPVATFRELFTDAVRLRLRADVEIGTCLSGGLDSSSIVSVACKELDHPTMHAIASLHTEPEADETHWVQAVARDTSVHLHPVRPTPTGLLDDMDAIVWHQERPADGASLYSQWEVMREAGRHVKVLLDGQGADELLGGYTAYFSTAVRALVRRSRSGDVGAIADLALGYPRMRADSDLPVLRRAFKESLPPGPAKTLQRWAERLGLKARPTPTLWAVDGEPIVFPTPPRIFDDPLLDLLHHQFLGPGLRSLLHMEDRSSMAFSVEGRLPFTDDHRLVELALSLPARWRIHRGSTKVILREAMRGILVEEVRQRRRKLGFPTPLATWLRRDERLRQRFSDADLTVRGLVSGDAARELLTDHLEGRADHSRPLFRLLTADSWFSQFIEAGGE